MPTLPTDLSPAAAAQAQRLLEAMRPVCSHDLPNQAVALQSLLQLFAWDEAPQLSPQGREYFERLQSIANKTMALTQYLKELARLQRYQQRGERMTFAAVVDDLRAEIQRAEPECRWTWQCRWNHDSFRADRRLVQQALVQLLRATCLGLSAPTASVNMKTTLGAANDIEWTITALPGAASQSVGERRATHANEARLAFTLAQEYLAATGIECRAGAAPTSGGATFTLVIPSQSVHD